MALTGPWLPVTVCGVLRLKKEAQTGREKKAVQGVDGDRDGVVLFPTALRGRRPQGRMARGGCSLTSE
jgi:hypothetical protein